MECSVIFLIFNFFIAKIAYFLIDENNDILFRNELETWKQHYNTTVSLDKATEGEAKTCYDARIGFVTEQLTAAQLSSQGCVALICGPPKMIEIAVAALKEKGFQSDKIFVSTERLMQCGIGKCGHCMIRGKYTCTDGPVFRLDEIEGYKND